MESCPSELVMLSWIIPTCVFLEPNLTRTALLQSFLENTCFYNVGNMCLQSFMELLFTILFDVGKGRTEL